MSKKTAGEQNAIRFDASSKIQIIGGTKDQKIKGWAAGSGSPAQSFSMLKTFFHYIGKNCNL